MGRLILFLVQLVVGWFAGKAIVAAIPIGGTPRLFIYAIVFAILAWICGLVAARILQGVADPSTAALTASVICGLIGAALLLVPQVSGLIRGVDTLAVPLLGAVLGYHLRR
jgi:hypothetical protein